ncbi:hypothetical protein K439DRAFT_1663529 [Ramaria rubella]|nr:hypothetical protein K439DRAFT_1663529 [Ramaria rubella]
MSNTSPFGSSRRPIKALPGSKRGSKVPVLTRRASTASENPPLHHMVDTKPLTPTKEYDARPVKRLKSLASSNKQKCYLRDLLSEKDCVLVCDSLDSDGLMDSKAQYTAVTPETLVEGLKEETNKYHVWVAVKTATETAGSIEARVKLALDLAVSNPKSYSSVFDVRWPMQLVELGTFQLERYPGCHFTFIDPRIAQDEDAIVHKLQFLSDKFIERGVACSKIVFNIPATLSGINAAKRIFLMPSPVNGIRINLIMVQALMHAAACIEAKPSSITLAVGPVLRWHEASNTAFFKSLHPLIHSGMLKLHTIRLYFEQNKIPVKLFAGECRQFEEAKQLLGFPAFILSSEHSKMLRWAMMSPSDFERDPLPPTTTAHQAVSAITYPTNLLSEVASQAEDPPDLLPPGMSIRTQQMAEHNIRNSLTAMSAKMEEFEAYVRAEVVKRDAIITPQDWDSPDGSGTKAKTSSPTKRWKIKKNGSLTGVISRGTVLQD